MVERDHAPRYLRAALEVSQHRVHFLAVLLLHVIGGVVLVGVLIEKQKGVERTGKQGSQDLGDYKGPRGGPSIDQQGYRYEEKNMILQF